MKITSRGCGWGKVKNHWTRS